MSKPSLDSIPEYTRAYVNQVPENNLEDAFVSSNEELFTFLRSIPEEKIDYAYAPGKWTIREVVQHVLDAERVFCYRAMCFARNEKISLPSFDENAYADASKAKDRVWSELMEELLLIRRATHLFFQSLDEEQLSRTGTANNAVISVESVGFILIGHAKHHWRITEERYLGSQISQI